MGAGEGLDRSLEISGSTMGTTFSIKVIPGEGEGDRENLRRLIEEALDEVDQKMSTWKQDSEISRFNRQVDSDSFPISGMTFSVLETSLAVSSRSDGAFDVTVGPLVNAWGFGPPGELLETPEQGVLVALSEFTGFRFLSLHKDAGGGFSVMKADPRVQIDLSGVAKGYAVDRVASRLESEAGIQRFMVEVGGEVRTKGTNAQGQNWKIAIESPSSTSRDLHTVVPLGEAAMATSGDYRNYYELEGQRISHTIDPRTGYPIRHGLASVTVVMESCAEADAWATALLVLGDEGVDLAESEGIASLFLFRSVDGKGFEQRVTSAFTQQFGEPRDPTALLE